MFRQPGPPHLQSANIHMGQTGLQTSTLHQSHCCHLNQRLHSIWPYYYQANNTRHLLRNRRHWVPKLPCWNLRHPSLWHDLQRSDPSHLANACCKHCQDSHPRSSHTTVLWPKQLWQDPSHTPAHLYHRQYR